MASNEPAAHGILGSLQARMGPNTLTSVHFKLQTS